MKYLILFVFLFTGVKSNQDCSQVFFNFVGADLTDFVVVSADDASSITLDATYYDPSKVTLIYTNGWRLNYHTADTEAVLNAYITKRRNDFNIIYLDWSFYNDNFVYITSLSAMLGVSFQAFEIVDRLRNNVNVQFDPFTTHMVGYDLGAHLLHMVAFEIQANYAVSNPFRFKVDRLTGLDPAGLFQFGSFLFLFFQVKEFGRNTATFTDVIHTSTNKFGFKPDIGNIDFYPDGGQTQAGCTAKRSLELFLQNQDLNQLDRLTCSHSRAWELYAESVLSDTNDVFQARICNIGTSLDNINPTNCDLNDPKFISMGFWADRADLWPTPGFLEFFPTLPLNPLTSFAFYVETNTESPYSMT